jgi:glycosyltransferase involved in cell wall biosynthesis
VKESHSLGGKVNKMVAGKRLKVLYVCPFAHYTGHFSWAAIHETRALADADVKVTLLTFCGVAENSTVQVPQLIVRDHTMLGIPIYYLANILRRWKGVGFISMFFESLLTLTVAIRLKRKQGFDIIQLRDNEPVLFLPHLLSFGVKGYSWVVSMTGTNFINAQVPMRAVRKNVRLLLYAMYVRFINANFWKPVYRRSLAKNRFIFLTQNETIKKMAESYLGGVLAGRVLSLPLGVNEIDMIIPKEEAREYFGLPQAKPVLLSFGFVHAGKDVETIFSAMKNIPDTFLLHGGDEGIVAESSKMMNLAKRYDMQGRAVIKNSYIPEDEKPYYFFAADAIILSYTKQFLSTTSLLWQACRFGTPVIASDNGQLKDLVEEFGTGLVFRAEDADSLREAILRFIKLKPAGIKTIQDNCHKFTREFSLKNWAQKCIEIYNQLLATENSRSQVGRKVE